MRPEARKAQIIEAAIRCFASRGYHSTQISDIIAKAGVARGTFYLYFKSKHEIFQFILDDFTKRIDAQIRVIELGAKESPAAQMRGNVERVIDVIFARPEIGRIIFNEAVGLDKIIDKRLQAFYKRIINMIASSIRRGIALGIVRDVDPSVAASIIMGAFREVIVQSAIFGNLKTDRKIIADNLIDVLIGGMGDKILAFGIKTVSIPSGASQWMRGS